MIGSGERRGPPRVIHIVESLDTGAVESWLLRMLRAGKTFGVDLDWTFYTTLSRPGRFDDAARELGATVVNSPAELGATGEFMRHLRRTIRVGRYEVLHSHHDIVSAVYLTAAAGISIRRRIVHVHNADLHVPVSSARKAAALREPMRRTCLLLADRIVGISRYTLETFLRGRDPVIPRDLVLYYGIDTAPFHTHSTEPGALRRSLNFPEDARLLLFVGRMVSYKNPMFVVEVLSALAAVNPLVCAIFVGTGPLEREIAERAKALNLTHRVRLLGWRDDTITLMQTADVFVFPRVETVATDFGKEGLGLVVVEAQAAGLPSLISRGIPEDAIVVRELCDVMSLESGPETWAGAVGTILERRRPGAMAALRQIEQSHFSLAAGFEGLMKLHQLES